MIENIKALLRESIITIPETLDISNINNLGIDENLRALRGALRSVSLSLFEVNSLLNNADRILKGMYSNVMSEKKNNFNTKVEYALTFKLFTNTLFHISARLTKFYIRDIVYELTRYNTSTPPTLIASGTTGPVSGSEVKGLAIFIYNSFFENDDSIARTNNIALNLTKMFEKLTGNESYIRNITKFFKDYISKDGTNSDVAQEVIDDFSEIKYDKLYFNIVSQRYLDASDVITTQNNLLENVIKNLFRQYH